MSRSGLRGARRTRVYDCNYNAGQNYYKPALDNLDRKLYGRPLAPLVSDRFDSPKPASLFSPTRETSTPFNDEPLSNARKRAERVITEDSFFDSRGGRVPKNAIGDAIREFDDEFKSTISKIRANKAKATNFASDADFDDTVDLLKHRRNRIDLDSAYDDSNTRGVSSSIKKSTVKFTSRREASIEPVAVTKWSALSKTTASEDSGASLRAKATKARLDDLESEMWEQSEKQAAREKRSQALRKFIADIDNDLAD